MMRISLLLLLSLLTACGTPRVTRVDAEESIDLSGLWNDTDTRLVVEEMIDDVLERAWLTRYTRHHKRPPTVIVGTVKNRSHEHIDSLSFIAQIERELINSGRVVLVASADERQAIRQERGDQDLHSSAASRKEMGQELGADYMLSGTISSIIDAVRGEQVRYYQINLLLISLVDNSKIWAGQKQIKKTVESSRIRP